MDANDAGWIRGNRPLPKRLNVRQELKRLSKDPLRPFLERVSEPITIEHNEFIRYEETYWCYYASLERFLPEQSIAVRWINTGPMDVRKAGGKYTPAQRQLADRYNRIARFLRVDFYNCLLWARILMDRVVPLSRHFLRPRLMPSYTSFTDHKKFLSKHVGALGPDEDYSEHIRTHTDWFDTTLKYVRDQFVVHASPKHMRYFGVPYPSHEYGMFVVVPRESQAEHPYATNNAVTLTLPPLIRNIESFLTWFCSYALNAMTR